MGRLALIVSALVYSVGCARGNPEPSYTDLCHLVEVKRQHVADLEAARECHLRATVDAWYAATAGQPIRYDDAATDAAVDRLKRSYRFPAKGTDAWKLKEALERAIDDLEAAIIMRDRAAP